ncbi:MAG: response regulator [Eubacteriales bacterium]|nr:response regulator [Eubacteriales bacterium]
MYRILLVDDEILVRDAIRENIDWAGLDCELVGDCENGQVAAEFIKTHEVDIVLTDICMPYMDGMELSHFLHDNYPDIVIVVFSGFGEFEYAKKAIQYNVSEYLLKPITAMELREVIGRMKIIVDQKQREKKKIENLTSASSSYKKNALMIRSKGVEALVKGTRDSEQSIRELQNMGISMEASDYRVAVIEMDLYSELSLISAEKRKESALMAFVLFNVCDEIITRENAGIVYQAGDNRSCVIYKDCAMFDSMKINRISREIQQNMKELMGMDVSIGIGVTVRSLEKLIKSYQTAEEALSRKYLLGGNLLIDMEQQETCDLSCFSLEKPLQEFAYAIKTGKKEEMELMLAKMEQAIKDAFLSEEQVGIYLQKIIQSAVTVSKQMVGDFTSLLKQQDKVVLKVLEQKSFQLALQAVKEYVQAVFEELQKISGSSGQRQALLAMDYIQTHYMEQDLSLNSVCSYLNISTSYFSTIFKEETGETFTEVLIRTRMDKAKELLSNTTLKNYEIAEMVGFSDPHYFGISFKKATGKTPTEYAKEMRR